MGKNIWSGYTPITPGGTYLVDLERKTEQEAWNALLKTAAHMPYKGIEGFKKRGYRVVKWRD